MTDRLTLTRAFEGAGLKSGDAERIATEIYDAIHDNVATKTDVDHAVTTLRTEMRELEQRLELRFERLERQIDRMVVRLGALVVVVAGLLVAAQHYWPPNIVAAPPAPAAPAQHASAVFAADDQQAHACVVFDRLQRQCVLRLCRASQLLIRIRRSNAPLSKRRAAMWQPVGRWSGGCEVAISYARRSCRGSSAGRSSG